MTTSKVIAVATFIAAAALPVVGARAQSLATLYNFGGPSDGQVPSTRLIYHRGNLYGTTGSGGTSGGGTVFKFDSSAGIETVLHSFTGNGDGYQPAGNLLIRDGILYGTTLLGGASNNGTVFTINPTTGIETILYSFAGGADGGSPESGLIYRGGNLYGTTYFGGASNNGSVFAMDPTTGAKTVLYSFAGGADGISPLGNLIELDGTLYGVTTLGGLWKLGTVFAVNIATGAEKVLHSFTGSLGDGCRPSSGLIYRKGNLYGTTACGGAVFSINLTTGAETVLYNFISQRDGGGADAGLVDYHGILYGVTEGGGAFNYGTVFKIDPTTGTETVLYSFSGGADGENPYGALTERSGIFYGTTGNGGTSNEGTIFKLAP